MFNLTETSSKTVQQRRTADSNKQKHPGQGVTPADDGQS